MNDVIVSAPRQVTAQSYSVYEVKAQVQQVQTLMRDLMKEGEHYGQSFAGDTKKNLLKPGADKLMFMFRLRPDFSQEIKELPNGHREVLTHCFVYHIESGSKIAEGVGSASTLESKYRYRNEKRKCPICGQETIIAGKKEFGGGWLCYAKKGGCGAKFDEDDPAITEQQTGKVENPDIADCYNTVLKISKKRAYVDATITATAASDIFTQDLEDIEPEKEAEPAVEKPPKQTATKKNTKTEQQPISEIDRLKKEAWKLIKQLPEDEQAVWVDSCKGADEKILNEVIGEIALLLEKPEQAEEVPPEELEIF